MLLIEYLLTNSKKHRFVIIGAILNGYQLYKCYLAFEMVDYSV